MFGFPRIPVPEPLRGRETGTFTHDSVDPFAIYINMYKLGWFASLTTEPRAETFTPQTMAVADATPVKQITDENSGKTFVKLENEGLANWWIVRGDELEEAQSKTITAEVEVGDDGVAHLRPLVHLTYLNLSGTRLTDRGAEHIEPLQQVQPYCSEP